MGITNTLLDPIFGIFLTMQPGVAIAILSVVISLLVTIVYKKVTDQDLIKILKADMKILQKEMKKGEPGKMSEIQPKFWKKNMELMKHTMRANLYTMIPLLIIFVWLSGHFAYEPLLPNENFGVEVKLRAAEAATVLLSSDTLTIDNPTQTTNNGLVQFKMKGPEGRHTFMVDVDGNKIIKDVEIATSQRYAEPQLTKKAPHPVERVMINHADLKPFGSFSLFGWRPGYLGAYIIVSLFATIIIRRMMRVQ